MKTLKPLRLGLLTRPFEWAGEHHLSVAILAFGTLDGSLLLEADLWKFVPPQLGPDAALDLGIPKPRGEVVVTGVAHVPGGVPRPACSVRVRLGAVDKTLLVVGDRVWHDGAMTEPAPFTSMPLGWDRAFGGPGFAQNPLGRGVKGDGDRLPNLEHPRARLVEPGDRPAPVGFGPMDITWPQRWSKAGTYDAAWLRERFPGFAADMDWSIFNVAQPDQQVDGFWRGDEAFTLEALHPARPVIEGRLPGLAARCLVTQSGASGDVTRELRPQLETVWFFPHEERVVMLYRASLPVAEDDARDVKVMLCALEPLDAPRPTQHYLDEMALRLDRENGYLRALDDTPLMPPRPDGAPEPPMPLTELDAMTATEGILERNLRTKAERAVAAAKADAAAQGVTLPASATELPPKPGPIAPKDVPAVVEQLEQMRARAEADALARRQAAEAEARAQCASVGIDYDAKVAEARRQNAGPPKFRARAEFNALSGIAAQTRALGKPNEALEAKLADPGFFAKLEAVERAMFDGYRLSAHHLDPVGPMSEARNAEVRAALVEALRRGISVKYAELSGADLAGVDLSNTDLKGVFLEGARLAGAKLRGCDLTGAVLARADLTGADLTGARLDEANLGGANLSGAWLVQCAMTRTILAGADLRRAVAQGAALDEADLAGALFEETDLRGAALRAVTFLRSDLRGLRLDASTILSCNVIECDLRGVSLSGARLDQTVFLASALAGANLAGATMTNLRVVSGCDLTGCDLRGASLPESNLRGAKLEGADLREADLTASDLSECALTGAKLDRARARDSRWVRADLRDATLVGADLMGAVLQKARLAGADLRHANLFGADLSRARGDDRTRLDEANVKRAVILRRAEER